MEVPLPPEGIECHDRGVVVLSSGNNEVLLHEFIDKERRSYTWGNFHCMCC